MSIGFQLLFVAFNSGQNLQSSIMTTDGFGSLGYYSLAVIYFSIGVGCFFSTSIINKLGVTLSLFIGGMGATVWVFSAIVAALKNINPES
jgi:hypothetical protein